MMEVIEHYSVELTSRFSDLVANFDDIQSPSAKEARLEAMCMMVAPERWYISASRLTYEVRLTKALPI